MVCCHLTIESAGCSCYIIFMQAFAIVDILYEQKHLRPKRRLEAVRSFDEFAFDLNTRKEHKYFFGGDNIILTAVSSTRFQFTDEPHKPFLLTLSRIQIEGYSKPLAIWTRETIIAENIEENIISIYLRRYNKRNKFKSTDGWLVLTSVFTDTDGELVKVSYLKWNNNQLKTLWAINSGFDRFANILQERPVTIDVLDKYPLMLSA